MEKQFQIKHKEEWEKTESEKRMEQLDSILEQTELSIKPEKTVILYKNRINKKNLSFNIVMTCFWFGLGFLLSGGSVGLGLIVVLILAPMMEWREVDRVIKIPNESIEVEQMEESPQKYLERPALELQNELEDTFYEKRSEDQSFAHIVNADQISEGEVPDTDNVIMSKTGSAKEMDKRLQSSEAKERLAERLTNHLIKVGQIKVSPKEVKKLSPEGKRALGEYLERTGQIKE